MVAGGHPSNQRGSRLIYGGLTKRETQDGEGQFRSECSRHGPESQKSIAWCRASFGVGVREMLCWRKVPRGATWGTEVTAGHQSRRSGTWAGGFPKGEAEKVDGTVLTGVVGISRWPGVKLYPGNPDNQVR